MPFFRMDFERFGDPHSVFNVMRIWQLDTDGH